MRPLRVGDRVVSAFPESRTGEVTPLGGVVVRILPAVDGIARVEVLEDADHGKYRWAACNLRLDQNGLDVMLELL